MIKYSTQLDSERISATCTKIVFIIFLSTNNSSYFIPCIDWYDNILFVDHFYFLL